MGLFVTVRSSMCLKVGNTTGCKVWKDKAAEVAEGWRSYGELGQTRKFGLANTSENTIKVYCVSITF